MAESEVASEDIPWAPCMAYEPEEEEPEGAAGAPVYQSRRWKNLPENKLKVHFMNAVPSTWRLTKEKVLEWANRWSVPRLKGIVPEFVMETDIDVSDVRIEFTRECGKCIHSKLNHCCFHFLRCQAPNRKFCWE